MVGGLNILADCFCLSTFAQRLRHRKAERDDRDQQSNLLIRAGGVVGVFGMLHAFMCTHGSSFH
jgi:hypothetical protein